VSLFCGRPGGKEMKKIFVTGDIVIDHHIYKGGRLHPSNRNAYDTIIKSVPGGACLLTSLLEHVFSEECLKYESKRCKGTGAVEQEEGANVEFLSLVDTRSALAIEHAYAIWKPYPLLANKKYEKESYVWRIEEFLGYGRASCSTEDDNVEVRQCQDGKSQVMSDCDIIVIDDGGIVRDGNRFGFRFNKEAWMPIVDLLSQDREGKKPWLVIKMSYPVGVGDLWSTIRENISVQERVIVVVSADDLRCNEVLLSSNRSWEQTIQDIDREFEDNVVFQPLKKARHLIVNFGCEGAVWFDCSDKDKCQRIAVFDPGNLEGNWSRKNIKGMVMGSGCCFVAGIIKALCENMENPDMAEGIRRGLSARRTLMKHGHGQTSHQKEEYEEECCGEKRPEITEPGFPFEDVAKTVCKHGASVFSVVTLPLDINTKSGESWSLMDNGVLAKLGRPLYGVARRVAVHGASVLDNIPYCRFGSLYTVDRVELESLNSISSLVSEYVEYDKGSKPLSIGVFGPPGSGKSFGIKQIVKGILGSRTPILEFNLSQFGEKPEKLVAALHMVRDKVLEGHIPVVFWDEFDSMELFWLQYLLAPMQDGAFLEEQVSHPIGKCIFVFAGGTSYTMQAFSSVEPEKEEWFKRRKGPDFVSRLHGYLNVLGPNQRQQLVEGTWKNDKGDTCFPIRRALLLRVMAGLYDEKTPLMIDSGLLNAFLKISEYRHGARSMESIINLTLKGQKGKFTLSNLPPREQIELHVDYDEFIQLVYEGRQFKKMCEQLASYIHGYYLLHNHKEEKSGDAKTSSQNVQGNNRASGKYFEDFGKLPPDIKDDNRAAARRISDVLSLIAMKVAQKKDGLETYENLAKLIEEHIEILAEAEHDGWCDFKRLNGWEFNKNREDNVKKHCSLLPYSCLDEGEQKKDVDSVRHYQEIVELAGYVIVPE
jgi:hypothetical protein